MASKSNIFSALPQHHSDSEDEGNTRTKVQKAASKGVRQDNRTDTKKTPGPSTGKEQHSRPKEVRKDKGVSDQPHPLDRHSGTGQTAYGAKPKKQGAGKGNWGSYKDEKRPTENVEEVEGEEVAEAEEEKPSLTLQEYYEQRNFGTGKQQVNEAKAKITSEQLMKEMGTATLLKGRHQQEIDDRRAGKKKEQLNADHRAAITTEHADLLGFRTGFIEKEYKQRSADDTKPGQGGPRGNRREPREQENAKEEEAKPATQTEGTQVEGQEAQTGEGQQETKGQGEERRRQEGGRGGHRGGDRPRGGNRPQGERRPQGGKQDAAKINFDDSAFPKLG